MEGISCSEVGANTLLDLPKIALWISSHKYKEARCINTTCYQVEINDIPLKSMVKPPVFSIIWNGSDFVDFFPP